MTTRCVALLRGVNVGRGRRVPMAEFKAVLESLGHGGVSTLLNSGNAVFDCAGASARVAAALHDALLERLAVDVPVLVKTAAHWKAAVAGNPMAHEDLDPSRLLVAFGPNAAALRALAPLAAGVAAPERFVIGAEAAYLWCPQGILQSAAASRLLGPEGRAVTTRNWATVLKIAERLG